MGSAKGRPSLYSAELAAEICRRLAEGESLRAICRDDAMPDKLTVLRWLDGSEEFRTQYARAREQQADHFAEEILEISDDGSNDWMQTEKGPQLDHEHVQRSKLRVDSRKWLMARMAPKKYGDRQQLEHSGTIGIRHEDALAELE